MNALFFLCINSLHALSPSSDAAVTGFNSKILVSQTEIVLASSSAGPADEDGSTAYANALNALKNNDNSNALVYIQRAVAINPGNLDYQYMLGVTYSRLSKLDEAQTIFFALIREDSIAFQKAYFDLSAIYIQKHDEQKALKMLEQAYSLDPGRTEIEMGNIYLNQKQYEKALEHFQRAALVKPELKADAANTASSSAAAITTENRSQKETA